MPEGYERFARTYDLEYGRLTEDITFYVDRAKETGGPALELAVGTGRVAIAIAREGIPVTGIDVTPAMLDVLRGKLAAEPGLDVHAVEGDMRDVDVTDRGPFGLVYVPARAFNHMLTVEDQLAALANARRHLRPDGLFAGNTFFPRVDSLARRQVRADGWDWPDEHRDPDTGHRVLVSELSRTNPREQRIEVLMRAEHMAESGEIVKTEMRELTLTYYWPRELEHLLRRAGFELTHLYGDFAGTPFADGGDELVWVAGPR